MTENYSSFHYEELGDQQNVIKHWIANKTHIVTILFYSINEWFHTLYSLTISNIYFDFSVFYTFYVLFSSKNKM